MNLTNVEALENKVVLKVEDSLTRKRFFADSSTIGWLFLKEGEKVTLHFIYVSENEEGRWEEFVDLSEELNVADEKEKILIEAYFQQGEEKFANELKEQLGFTL